MYKLRHIREGYCNTCLFLWKLIFSARQNGWKFVLFAEPDCSQHGNEKALIGTNRFYKICIYD